MPRSTHEATRFTATQPYAHSPAFGGGPASTIPLASEPPRPNETPAQKVARLRDAARRAKLGRESTWDKVVLRGRVWADRAHKVTATGLILASVVATGLAGLSFGEMIMANRGKKAEWYKQQQLAYERALEVARQAEADGTLTSDLALFLNKERAVEQAEEEKRRRGGMWQQAKRSMFGGLKMEDAGAAAGLAEAGGAPSTTTTTTTTTPGQTRSLAVPNTASAGDTTASRAAADAASSTHKSTQLPRATAEDSRIVENRQPGVGVGVGVGVGSLDRLGADAVRSFSDNTRGWLGWLRGQ